MSFQFRITKNDNEWTFTFVPKPRRFNASIQFTTSYSPASYYEWLAFCEDKVDKISFEYPGDGLYRNGEFVEIRMSGVELGIPPFKASVVMPIIRNELERVKEMYNFAEDVCAW